MLLYRNAGNNLYCDIIIYNYINCVVLKIVMVYLTET